MPKCCDILPSRRKSLDLSWIGIDGEKVETYLKAAGLNNDTLIFKYNDGDLLKEYILEMLKHNTSSSSDSLLKLKAYFICSFQNLLTK